MAKTGKATFTLEIKAAFAELKKGIAGANKETQGGFGMLTKWAGIAAAAFAGVQLVIKPIIGMVKQYCTEALKAIEIDQRLLTMTKLRGDASGRLANAIMREAQALQVQTGMSDEAYKAGAAILQMSHSLTDQQIPKMMALMGDLAKLIGGGEGGISSAAMLLTRIAEGSFESLQRYGIRLTETEKALQEELRATGREIEANDMLIGKLQKTLGGVAAGANTGVVGSLNTIKTSSADIRETIGRMMLREVEGVIGDIAVVIRKVADALEDINKELSEETPLHRFIRMIPMLGSAQGLLDAILPGVETGGANLNMERIAEMFGFNVKTYTRSLGMPPEDAAKHAKEFAERNAWLSESWFGQADKGAFWRPEQSLRQIQGKESPWSFLGIADAQGVDPESMRRMWGIDSLESIWQSWWEDAGAIARTGIESVMNLGNMLGTAFGNVFRGIETDWDKMIRNMLASWAQTAMTGIFNKLIFGAAGGLAAGGPIGGLLGGLIGGFGGGSGDSMPVQFITADPTSAVRHGRRVYSADNQVVSGLTGRNLGRDVYQRN